MKLRYLFHNPKGERGIGKAIVAWTWLLACFYNWKALRYNFSHVEIWIPECGDRFRAPRVLTEKKLGDPAEYWGQCVSSTTRGGAKGVRFAPASEVLKHPERWSYIEVEVDDDVWPPVLAEMKFLVELGIKYDYLGLFGFLLPINIHDKKKYFCSELCMWAAYRLNIILKRHKRISPRRSALVLAKKYGEPKRLKG